jgi:hypothetical protein
VSDDLADRIVRSALAVLALIAVPLGLWASIAPRGFYDEVPGAGRVWVAVDGPYNEHLVRDFGALNLALGVVTIVAAVTLGRAVVLAAAGAWIAWSLPHLVYHVRHRDVYDGLDQVLNLTALAGALVLPAIVVITELRRPSPSPPD